jgi:peptide/nickel transport system permease protein/peptide/nickel transport system substrate-binding protein
MARGPAWPLGILSLRWRAAISSSCKIEQAERENIVTKDIDLRPHLTRRDALALMTGALAAAVSGGEGFAQTAPRRGGILHISAGANPSSLDPTTGGAGSDHVFLYNLYDTLTEWDYDTLEPRPGLAESWNFSDPTTLVLNLRQGVTFHDGTALDADAVKFNLDRNKTEKRSNIKADLVALASVDVTGSHQVTLRLANPDSALPGILSDRAGMMVSPTAIKANGNLDRAPVGCGAYTFDSWNDNDRIVLKRNETYWKPNRPYLDGIEFAIIPELTTGLRSVIAGQNDFIYSLPARQKPILDRAKNLQVVTAPTVYCVQFYMNWARPPFDNLKVRQALNFAIDRDAFVKAAFADVGEPARMNLPSSHWAYDKSVAGLYPYDPDKARKLLAEAGYPGGLDVEMGGYTDQDSVQREEILIEQLRKAGFNVRFLNGSIAEASAAFFGAEKKGAALLSAWTGRPDPSLTYSLMYTKDSYFNAGRGDVPPELTAAIKASRASQDIETRRKAFSTIQRIVMEQALVAPLVLPFEIDAMTKRVKGFRPNLLGKPKFEDVWLEV